jgi:hypothetical protein
MNDNLNHKSWDNIKNVLIQLYPKLTRADLAWRQKTKDDIIEMIANKLGKTTTELLDEINRYKQQS